MRFKNYDGEYLELPDHLHNVIHTVKPDTTDTALATAGEIGFMSKEDKIQLITASTNISLIRDKLKTAVYISRSRMPARPDPGTLLPGGDFNDKLNEIINEHPEITVISFTNTAIPKEYIATATEVSTADSTKVYMYYADGQIYISPLLANAQIYANENSGMMFLGLSNITTINFDNFDTSNTTIMNNMFSGCNSLEYANVSNFDMTKVENTAGMFLTCANLSSSITIANPTAPYYNTMFKGCSSAADAKFIVKYTNADTKLLAKLMVATKNAEDHVFLFVPTRLVTGQEFNTKLKSVMNAKLQSNFSIVFTETVIPSNLISSATMVSTTDSENKIYLYNDPNDFSILYISPEVAGSAIYANEDSSKMFYLCNNIRSIDLTYLNTSEVVNAHNMFGMLDMTQTPVENLYPVLEQIIGLDKIDTSNMTDMSWMFAGCNYLETLDLSHFKTSKVINMNSMFVNCELLTSINLSGLDVSKVEDMTGLFINCQELQTIDLSTWKTPSLLYTRYMFIGCRSLTTVRLSNFDTTNVADMSFMFATCKALPSVNLLHFKTGSVVDMNNMFYACESLTSLDLSSFDTTNVLDTSFMFAGCIKLSTLDISNFNTAKVQKATNMFANTALTSLDLSHFDTTSMNNTSWMFNGCTSVTGNITIMNPNIALYDEMFTDCSLTGKFTVNYASGCITVAQAMVNTKSPTSNVVLGTQK